MEEMFFVEFDHYCPRCKHKDIPETQDPCEECLSQPAMLDSYKPLHFTEEGDNKR